MPELADDQPASGMNGVGDQSPAGDLPVRPDAQRERIAAARWRNDGVALGNDQPGTGALRVVRHHLVWRSRGCRRGSSVSGAMTTRFFSSRAPRRDGGSAACWDMAI